MAADSLAADGLAEAALLLAEVALPFAGAADLAAGLAGAFFSAFFVCAVDLEPADLPAFSPPAANENDSCLPSVDAISVILKTRHPWSIGTAFLARRQNTMIRPAGQCAMAKRRSGGPNRENPLAPEYREYVQINIVRTAFLA